MVNIKKEELIRFLKFVAFSISAGVIQIVSFTLLHSVFKIIYWPSYLTALVLSVVWNFTVNRKFTFKSANNIPVAMIKVAIFYLIFTPLSTWWGDTLTVKFSVNDFLVLIGTMIINFITEFLYQRIVVFGKSINTAEK